MEEDHRALRLAHRALARRRRADRREPTVHGGAQLLLEDDELAAQLALAEAEARARRKLRRLSSSAIRSAWCRKIIARSASPTAL